MVGLLTGLISLITLIVFFVMASGIGSIKKDMAKVRKFVDAYSKQTGIGMSYVCSKCKEKFAGKVSECPHCQAKTGLS